MSPSRQRERELARARMQRRAARRAARRARTRRRATVAGAALGVIAVVAAVGYVAAQGSGARPATQAAATPSPSASSAFGVCQYLPAPKAPGATVRNVGLPPSGPVNTTTPYVATMVTNRGTITFQLLTSKAPCTVNSFRFLASRAFFNNTPCHRVTATPGLYVLQCGDPGGTGTGGPGYQFKDENLAGAKYTAGTVAMANSGPNTNGSQFFIVYQDSQLPPDYTIFGRVTGGLSVVTKVAAAGSTPPGDGRPKLPVTIKSMTVRPS